MGCSNSKGAAYDPASAPLTGVLSDAEVAPHSPNAATSPETGRSLTSTTTDKTPVISNLAERSEAAGSSVASAGGTEGGFIGDGASVAAGLIGGPLRDVNEEIIQEGEERTEGDAEGDVERSAGAEKEEEGRSDLDATGRKLHALLVRSFLLLENDEEDNEEEETDMGSP